MRSLSAVSRSAVSRAWLVPLALLAAVLPWLCVAAPPAAALCPVNSDTCGVPNPFPTPALTGLHVVSATRTTVTLAWNDSMTDESGYQVTVSGHNTYTAPGTHGASTVPTGPQSLPAQAGAGTYTWTAASLTPAWTWTFWVNAVRNGTEGQAQSVTAQTIGDPPMAPAATSCSAPPQAVGICWTNPTPTGYALPPDSFRIDRAPAGSTSWTPLATLDASAASYSDTAPPYGAGTCWRVVAVDNGGATASNAVCLTVPGAAPKDPSNVLFTAWNGSAGATWTADPSAASYVLSVSDGTSTSYRTVTGGTSGTLSASVAGIGCGHRVTTTLQAQTPGHYPGTVLSGSPTVGCATAPDVTNLSGAGSGTTITWTWNGSSADTSYTVTLSDPDHLLIWQPQTVAGGHNGAVTYSTPYLTAGHTYHLLVVTHRSGNYDSPGAGASASLATASTGVREVDVYNCSAAGNRTMWMSTGGAWTNAGTAIDVGYGNPCGRGASDPLKITLPNGYVTLEATNDGQQPNGTDNVKYTQTFLGSDTGQVAVAVLQTS